MFRGRNEKKWLSMLSRPPGLRRLRARYERSGGGDWFKGYRPDSHRTSSNSPQTTQRRHDSLAKGKLLYDSALLPRTINIVGSLCTLLLYDERGI